MTIREWVSGISLVSLVLIGCNQAEGGNAARSVTTDKDKISYAIGMDIGRSFKQQNLGTNDVDMVKVRMGIEDILKGTKPLLSDSQVNVVMMGFQQKMMARQDSVRKVQADSNLKVAQSFLEKNGKDSGVVTLPSGLQYKVITEGTGKKPDSSSTVTVHYTGALADGTEFDSSIKRGQPATFPVVGVIPGWTQALQLMTVGSKWKLFIPPQLGYGPQGAGARIPPNSALVFEVELISIADPAAAAQAKPVPAGHSAHDGHNH